MKRIIGMLMLLALSLLPWATWAETLPGDDAALTYQRMVYGYSELGRELVCYRIGDDQAARSMLMIFGVHGFEDSFSQDAIVLHVIADEITIHYAAQPDLLQDFCLYIIPTANPDGLIDGVSQDGFGRCNANGLDINRDFPVNWRKRTESRNRTGDAPFSTAEARAIRDLVEQVAPTYAIDVHGWINAAYGDGRMARVFAKPFGFSVKEPVSGGMLCSWLDQVTEEAIMLELPYAPSKDDYVRNNSQRLIEGIDQWIEKSRPTAAPQEE